MIVINKRYYDYDYDNGTIIMFDADDDEVSNVLGPSSSSVQSPNATASKLESQSQSTETVPDDLIKPPIASKSNPISEDIDDDGDDIKKQPVFPNKDKGDKEHIGSISWISSKSPIGLKRIPYAIQTAHSYSINKLEVHLTTLVDVATIERQKQQRLEAQQKAIQAAMFAAQQRHNEQWQRAYQHGAPPPHHPPHPHHGPHHYHPHGPPPPHPHQQQYRYPPQNGAPPHYPAMMGPPDVGYHGYGPPAPQQAPHGHPAGPPHNGGPPGPVPEQYRIDRRYLKQNQRRNPAQIAQHPHPHPHPRHAEDAYFAKQRQRPI